MYELEKLLKNNIDELKMVSFHADEANTDRPLKEFMKKFIKDRFNRIHPDKLNKHLILTLDGNELILPYIEFKDIYIKNVFLPNELTAELKKYIVMSKSSVYTNPDLFFELTNGVDINYISIELKSTKNNSIPGSSIQQVNPNEWVIFVKHIRDSIDIVTGKYIHSINSRLQFPDRSPRPQVAFNELKNWNDTNRYEVNSQVSYTINSTDEKIKHALLNDWQNYLADRWVEVLFTNGVKTNEPWFNNKIYS